MATDTTPAFVRREPRYAETGEDRWDLDGQSWSAASPPPQGGHVHVAQSVGWIGLSLLCRCSCGAATYYFPDRWFYPEQPRWAPTAARLARPWWRRPRPS